MNANIEALARFFVAINRSDMDAITRDFNPAIVRIEPEGFPSAGTCCGIAEVLEHPRCRATTAHLCFAYPPEATVSCLQ